MNRTAKQFEGLLTRFFETLLHDNPTFSTIAAGLRDGEGKLGRLLFTQVERGTFSILIIHKNLPVSLLKL
jgi:hypothetical protein